MTTRDLTGHRDRILPPAFPTGRFADTFPMPSPDLVARTVFTTYQVGDLDQAVFRAVCACGEQHSAASMILLRRSLGVHSCRDELGRPIELVPVDDLDHPDATLMLVRLLAGLREL